MHVVTYSSTLTVEDETTVAGLVGESCLIDCLLNDQATLLLLDTGLKCASFTWKISKIIIQIQLWHL